MDICRDETGRGLDEFMRGKKRRGDLRKRIKGVK